MADTEQEKTKEEKKAPDDGKIGIVTWIIMAIVILGLSGSGFVVGRLVAGSTEPAPMSDEMLQQVAAQPETDSPLETNAESETKSQDSWYYDKLASVVVNPDEPGATRFVRVGLILELDSDLTPEKAEALIPKKGPLLTNWLNLYFKGLSLDQMEDEKDMNHILSQITDAFNEILFPDAKPMVKRTLIREFNIQ